MKSYKLFTESNDTEPQVGDYVIVNTKNSGEILKTFLLNNIGKIERIESEPYKKHFSGTRSEYIIYFDNIPDDLSHLFPLLIFRNEIEYFSSNKEELEHIITANKYNL